MNKLDIIIYVLELASHVPKGVVYPAGYPMQIAQALAAARELRDAESKTQQWGNPKYLIEEAVLAERQACIDIIETYQIPVGNSPQGELAADWTYAALHQIRDEIKQRGEK